MKTLRSSQLLRIYRKHQKVALFQQVMAIPIHLNAVFGMIEHYDLLEREGLTYGGLVELIVNAMVDVNPGFIKWEEDL